MLPGPAVHAASAEVAPASSSSAPLAEATGVGAASSGDVAPEQEVRAGGDVSESSSDVEVIEPVAVEEALLSAPAADVMEVLGYRTDCNLPIDRKAASLRNVGNTCYLNALLQALAALPRVAMWASEHARMARASPSHDVQRCALCAFA